MNKRIVVYPGTFDPITLGHIDVLDRACNLFDHVIVAIAVNSAKTPLFTVDERKEMIEDATSGLNNIEVDAFEGLLAEYASLRNAAAILRGLRAVTDFEYELQMALMNRNLREKIATVFLMPHEKYVYLSSSIVREVASFGEDVSHLVPELVAKKLKKKFALGPDRVVRRI